MQNEIRTEINKNVTLVTKQMFIFSMLHFEREKNKIINYVIQFLNY